MSTLGTLLPIIDSFHRKTSISEFHCNSHAFTHFTVGLTQILNLVVIALSRYICICIPESTRSVRICFLLLFEVDGRLASDADSSPNLKAD